MVGSTLALDLDQYREILGSLAVIGLEGLEQLEAVALRINSNIDRDPIYWRSLISILTWVIATGRELFASGVGELERFAV